MYIWTETYTFDDINLISVILRQLKNIYGSVLKRSIKTVSRIARSTM